MITRIAENRLIIIAFIVLIFTLAQCSVDGDEKLIAASVVRYRRAKF